MLAKDLWMKTRASDALRELEGWKEACALWSGVRDCKITIKGDLSTERVDEDGQKLMVTILDVHAEWVLDGLCQLKNLRYLELEIEDGDAQREEKVGFCADLAMTLEQVQIVFREEIELVEEEVPNSEFRWFGGEPGDDLVWGREVGR